MTEQTSSRTQSKTLRRRPRRSDGSWGWATRLPLVLLAVAAGLAHSQAAPQPGPVVQFTHAADRATFVGGPKWFTGTAHVAMLFAPDGARTFGGATVTFEPGARTAWHTHPAGQTLVVTEGHGWVQADGEPRRDLKPGDVVWTPPGVRHWHGATTKSGMTHVALQGAHEGQVVDWQEQVSDAQYQGSTP